MNLPRILAGLGEIAQEHDALICDVWGVLHNGRFAYPEAAEALRRFRASRGPVVLLTNAPRPVGDIEQMFQRLGVPLDCYDAIMTSGVAAREDLASRAKSGVLKMLHLGPERDRGVFAGLPVDSTAVEQADIVLNTGLYD